VHVSTNGIVNIDRKKKTWCKKENEQRKKMLFSSFFACLRRRNNRETTKEMTRANWTIAYNNLVLCKDTYIYMCNIQNRIFVDI
jgi:hypothetical protein